MALDCLGRERWKIEFWSFKLTIHPQYNLYKLDMYNLYNTLRFVVAVNYPYTINPFTRQENSFHIDWPAPERQFQFLQAGGLESE